MKRLSTFLLIIFLITLFSAGGLSYFYWWKTGSLPLADLKDEPSDFGNDDIHYPSKNQGVVVSSINVLEQVDLPMVWVNGKVGLYKIVTDPVSKERTLLVVFESKDGILPVRLSLVSANKIGEVYVVNQLQPEELEHLESLLKESQADSSLVSSNYLLFFSPRSKAEQQFCLEKLRQVGKDENLWCPFDSRHQFIRGRSGEGTNCSNVSGPASIALGQSGDYSANFYSPEGSLAGEIFYDNLNRIEYRTLPGNSASFTTTWTPASAGNYEVCCRAWNDAVAECRPPQYNTGDQDDCAGRFSGAGL